MKEERKRKTREDETQFSTKKKRSDELLSSAKNRSHISHLPMSERQQFALLKQMETELVKEKVRTNSPVSDKSSPRLSATGVSCGSSVSSSSSSCSSTSCRSNSSLPNPKSRQNFDPNIQVSGRTHRERTLSSTSSMPEKKTDKKNRAGETQLIKMAKKGDLEAVKALVKDGANINEQDYAGWTALHESSIRNHVKVVAYLLKHGANPNICGLHGDTALHDAAKHGHIQVVKNLLRYKADCNVSNSKNERPFDIAIDDNVRNLLKHYLKTPGRSLISDTEESESDRSEHTQIATAKTNSSTPRSALTTPNISSICGRRTSINTLNNNEPPSSLNDTLVDSKSQIQKKDPYAFDENEDDDMLNCPSSFEPSVSSNITGNPLLNTSPLSINLNIPSNTPSNAASPTIKGSLETLKRPSSRSNFDSAAISPNNSLSIRIRFAKEAQGQYNSTMVENQSNDLNCSATPNLLDVKTDTNDESASILKNTENTMCPNLSSKKDSISQSVCSKPTDEMNHKTSEIDSQMDEERIVPPLRIKLGTPETEAASGCSSTGLQQTFDGPSNLTGSKRDENTDNNSPTQTFTPFIKDSSSRTQNLTQIKKDDVGDSSPSKFSELLSDNIVKFDKVPSTDAGNRHRTGRTLRSHTAALREKEEREKFTPNSSRNSFSGNDNTPLKKRKLRSRGEGNQSDSGLQNDTSELSIRNNMSQHHGSSDDENFDNNGDAELRNLADDGSSKETSFAGVVNASNTSSLGNNSQDDSIESMTTGTGSTGETHTISLGYINPYEKAMHLHKGLRDMISKMVQIHTKAPTGYQDYLMVKKDYILANNVPSQHIKHLQRRLPAELLVPGCEPLEALFREQESERRIQGLKHQSEREQLTLSAEQAVLRAHTRAALAMALQPRPLSFCSVFSLENITFIPPIKLERDEESVRDRFTTRTFLSWIQDIRDSFQLEKKKMLCRQLHEAESLMMVQKLDWELKVKSLRPPISGNAGPLSSLFGKAISARDIPSSYVPIVEVPEDFSLFVHEPVY